MSTSTQLDYDQLDQAYRNRLSSKRYFSFYTDYLLIMDFDEAAVFQFLLNLWDQRASEDGWVLFKSEFLQRGLRTTRYQEERIMKKLEDKGFIQRKRAGNPAKRYVKALPDVAEKLVQEARKLLPQERSIPVSGEPAKTPTKPRFLENQETRFLGNQESPYKTSTTKTTKDSRGSPTHAGVAEPPPVSDDAGDGVEGLAVKPGKARHGKALPVDAIHANQLISTLMRQGRITGTFKRSQWANELRLLREGVGGDDGRVAAVLDWLDATPPDKYTPLVCSAKAFRAKFPQLEAAMKRGAAPPPVTITPKAEWVVNKLKDYKWPKGAASHLPQAVQKSLTAFRLFLKNLLPLATNGFPRFVQSKLCIPPEDFVLNWFERVHRRIATWEDWSGNLDPCAWTPTHKDMTKLGSGWAAEWGVSESKWDDLVKTLTKE
jgi:hypothetical protein